MIRLLYVSNWIYRLAGKVFARYYSTIAISGTYSLGATVEGAAISNEKEAENTMYETIQEADLKALIDPELSKQKGPMAFIEQLDWKVPGIGPGKLVVIGAYVGSYKTLLAINMAYNNAIELGYNVVFLSLEMYEREILQRLIVRHANNPKFSRHGQQITMSKLREGEISPDERSFLENEVIRDLQNNPEYGRVTVVDSLSFDAGSIEQVLGKVDEKGRQETGQESGKTDMIIIDYLQLLAQYWGDGRDMISATRNTARYLKRLALTYNGRGLVVVALSQLSRAAFLAAKENVKNSRESDPYQYLYGVTSFADSAEVERASDICLTIFVDDKLREKHSALVQLIKNRDGETIEKGFQVMAVPDTSYIGDLRNESASEDYLADLLEDVPGGL